MMIKTILGASVWGMYNTMVLSFDVRLLENATFQNVKNFTSPAQNILEVAESARKMDM